MKIRSPNDLRLRPTHTGVRWLCLLTVLGMLAACKPKTNDNPRIDSATATPVTKPDPAATASPAMWMLSEFGYGHVRVGMTYAAANDTFQGQLKAAKGANLAECSYVKWDGQPGLLFMVIENKIARIDVISSDSTLMITDAGAKIGDTEDRIKELYAGRVTVSPHKYEEGHYLRVKSADASDTTHFIVFETVKGKVTRFRGGKIPEVDFVEGCS